MTTKPTPGPYKVRPQSHGTSVEGRYGVSLAWFPCSMMAGRDGSYRIDAAEAEANARAFVAALESAARREGGK